MKSVYQRYVEHRAAGFAPMPAAQTVAEMYGRRTAAEIDELAAALLRLEARDTAAAAAPRVRSQSDQERTFI